MAAKVWVDDTLKAARLTHRVFIGIAVAYVGYLITVRALPRPLWDAQFDALAEHWQEVRERVEDEAEQLASAEGLDPAQICVQSSLGSATFADWEAGLSPRVAEIQSLREVEILTPVVDPPGEVDDIEADCKAPVFVRVLDTGDRQTLTFRSTPLRFSPERLTVINGYELYGLVKDTPLRDAREIVEYKLARERVLSAARLPIGQGGSLVAMCLGLTLLMGHTIIYQRRLETLAHAGHESDMRGFPWFVTMTTGWIRCLVNLLTFALPASVAYFAVITKIMSPLSEEGKYKSPSWYEWVAVLIVAAVGGVLVWTQWSLQRSISGGHRQASAEADAPAETSSVPVRLEPFDGRSAELEQLAENTKRRLYTVILGAPGAGKTTLAFEFGRRELSRLAAGVFVVDCRREAYRGLAALLPLLEGEARDTRGPDEARARRALHLAAKRECLLIYDGVDNVPGFLAWLPPAGHRCRVIATSRCAAEEWPTSAKLQLMELQPLPPS